jgi:hypothetical protein
MYIHQRVWAYLKVSPIMCVSMDVSERWLNC